MPSAIVVREGGWEAEEAREESMPIKLCSMLLGHLSCFVVYRVAKIGNVRESEVALG